MNDLKTSPTIDQAKPVQRIEFLDYLRVISITMVLMVHAIELFYLAVDHVSIKPGDEFWVTYMSSPLRACVPLFVMASGYLLVPVKASSKEFYTKRFTRILVPFAVWSVLYAVVPYFFGADTFAVMQTKLTTLLHNFNLESGHLWFIYMLVGVYLFLPIISPWLKSASKRFIEFYLVLWFLSSFHHYLKLAFPDGVFGEVFWNEFHSLWYFSGHLGFVVLAFYFRKFVHLNHKQSRIIGLIIFGIGYAITAILFGHFVSQTKEIYLVEMAWRFCTPNVILMTIGLFMLIRTINIKNEKVYSVVKELSRLSYGVYLSHLFFVGLSWTYIVQPLGYSTPISILLVTILTWVASNVLVKILSYLPKSKYFIG
ncbi:acyltransferase family protein [Flammeovirga yaeyamensis]|uniref:Acyltransferase family protein n=1 Tax=Flammeovirga yaeyamensis TaxID=367791 RepID=A0AAX1N989_9BACT|nr:acyltransferase [Flammeovirga yaeyamensis]MBB3699480.1 surface polysaccharide O-acyltransferase-like enzyme [Flammeovirga yaeyamensis]NMF35263.1 acyltransferase [Flammeovirga yaeyamensis]QWG04123.1 acyltransferase family protein [Flammeovirga yaeyamensis]